MVGLSDIPCVGKVVDRISDAVVDALFRGCGYLFCYQDGVDDLNSEIENLDNEVDRVSRVVGQELANGKVIKKHVLKWQEEAEKIQKSAKEFSEKYKNRPSWRCIQFLPIPDPVSRFQLAREAVHMTKKVVKLIDSARKFLLNEIADLRKVQNLPKNDRAFLNFQSRKDAYEKLWEALLVSDGSSVILGIYGMSGTGKTRMAEQIWEEAIKNKIFEKVIRANVGSERLDELELQKQIAGYLNCNFESPEDVAGRASQLEYSLANEGKVLIILDDVWSKISIDKIIGTSFGDGSSSKGSKILLTSRDKRVCTINKCKDPVNITPLDNNEAWDLFSNTVGTKTIDSLKDESLAREVCKKCAGLPLIIGAVGKALESRSHSIWSNARDKLIDGKIGSVLGITPQVYACLKLSFDNLEQEDAKVCLLLCSIFPEDADIPIKTLTQLATGSELVHGGRTGVLAMVDILKPSLLLFEGKDDQHFKLHDIIRDVARSIAVEEYAFILEKCDSQLLHNSAHYAKGEVLLVDVMNNVFHFPDHLLFPAVHTLYLRSMAQPSLAWNKCSSIRNLSGGMFKNLIFLVLDNFGWLQQFSLQPLDGLKTLFLNHCALHYIDGFPQSLHTLCLWHCYIPQPINLPRLPFLLKLEILGNADEVQFPPDTIYSLSRLKELHIPKGFSIWGYPDAPILPEIIEEFICLTSLQISLGGSGSLTYTDIFCNLIDFNINLGSGNYFSDNRDYDGELTRLIELSGNQLEGFRGLVERAEQAKFQSTDVKVSSIFNTNRKAFTDLINLYIEECDTMEYLARLSQDEIRHRDPLRTSFSKLTILDITKCYGMKYLFCNSVAKSLVELQELSISSCPSLKVIVMHEGTSDGGIIDFSKLKSLKIYTMCSLKSFYGENKDTSDISDDDHIQPLFSEMVAFPSLEVLELQALNYTSDLWGNCYKDQSSFSKLKSLFLWKCTEVKNVIPLAMSHKLQNLESLSIKDCPSVISELGTNDSNMQVSPLVALRTIDLRNLPCLTHTGLNSSWDHSGALYPNIQILHIWHCPKMKNVFLPSIAKNLVSLKDMWIISCENISEIIVAGEEEEFSLGDVFPELSTLHLDRLPNLTSIWCYRNGKVQFPNSVVRFELCRLSSLDLSRLPKLKSFFHGANYECHMRDLNQVDIYDCELVSTLFTCSVFSELQGLNYLRVSDCSLLKGIVEDAGGDKTRDTRDKIIKLSQLSSVVLTNLPNLSSFIHSSKSEFHMPALKVVQVHNCGLLTLFTCSVLKDLQQLNCLHISSCTFLERIDVDKRSDETSNMNDRTNTLFQLNSVVLTNLPNLQSFICGANYECYMPALMEVKIIECGLSTIFTCSAFRSLQQLRKIEVSDCRLLKGIVEDARGEKNSNTNDVIITLNQLSSVIFRDLPNLKNFTPTGATAYKVKIPNLVNFELIGCGEINLEAIEFGRDDFTCPLTDLKISCNNQIQLPRKWQLQLYNLERLTLTSCWWHELESLSFQRLEVLKIYNSGCSALFTFSGLESLHQLQKFEISNCPLLEDIVEDVRGDEASAVDKKTVPLSQLKSIVLNDLPSLKSFIQGANYECHMPALSELRVNNCGLSTLFTWSAFGSLQQLRKLEVSDCRLLEGIVEDARGEENYGTCNMTKTLYQLSSVILRDLPNLKSFAVTEANAYKVNIPNLMKFELIGCGKINLEAIGLGTDDFTCQLTDLKISCNNEIQLPCKWQLQLYNLKSLSLTNCWWHELESLCFQRLQVLKIQNSGCSALFAFSSLRSLERLQSLEISNCALLENIVEDVSVDEASGVDKKAVTLFQLTSIILKDLPNLKSFIHSANFECYVPSLTNVEVENCGLSVLFTCSVFKYIKCLRVLVVSNCTLLKGIVEDARADETSAMNDKIITLFGLSLVVLNDLPNLKSFIQGANYECHMPYLSELRVNNCGLLTLFTCSAFGSLQHLWKLEVSDCRLLEDIVEDARVEENYGTRNMIMTFRRLSSVILRDLPNLKSFSRNVSYALNMPELDQFWLTGCPQVENFTSLKTSTGLVSVFSEWHQGERVPDLSEYITQNRKRKSNISDSAGESSYSFQEPETESMGDEEQGSNLSQSAGESSYKNQEGETEAEGVKEDEPEEEI